MDRPDNDAPEVEKPGGRQIEQAGKPSQLGIKSTTNPIRFNLDRALDGLVEDARTTTRNEIDLVRSSKHTAILLQCEERTGSP